MCSEGYCIQVCLSVCLSVKSHLTSGASVHPKINTTYSVGKEGSKNMCLKHLHSRDMGWNGSKKNPIANEYQLPQPSFEFMQRPFSTIVTPNGLFKDKATQCTAQLNAGKWVSLTVSVHLHAHDYHVSSHNVGPQAEPSEGVQQAIAIT